MSRDVVIGQCHSPKNYELTAYGDRLLSENLESKLNEKILHVFQCSIIETLYFRTQNRQKLHPFSP